MSPPFSRPPSLPSVLDAGGDLTTLPGWDVLAEASSSTPRSHVWRRGRSYRARVEAWLAGDLTWGGVVWAPDQAAVTRLAWEAECLDEDQMAERLEAALPDDKRTDFLLLRVEMLWPE